MMLLSQGDSMFLAGDVSVEQVEIAAPWHPALAGLAKREGSEVVVTQRRTASKSKDLAIVTCNERL